MTVYYSPEHSGLKEIGQVDWPDADAYGFSMTVVWQQEGTGYLYVASDQGCSCPTPFEDIKGLGDLTPIDRVQTLIDDLNASLKVHASWCGEETLAKTTGEVGELVQMVRNAWQTRPTELAEHWDQWWTDARRMAAANPAHEVPLMALCPDGHMRDLLKLFPKPPEADQ